MIMMQIMKFMDSFQSSPSKENPFPGWILSGDP
jgi:hypothetical protein